MKHLSDRIRSGERAEAELEKKLHLIWLDRLALTAGMIGPLSAIPQLYLIISTRSAQGVSMITWVWAFVSSFIWLIYGLVHREKAIVIPGLLWLVLEVAIVLAIVAYP